MDPLIRQFDRIGARARIVQPRWGFTLDVRDEVFEIARPEDVRARVVATDAGQRHLLLLAEREGQRDRFVCGHDERHWFVAAVPGAPGTVAQALEALKPTAVRQAEQRAGVPTRHRRRRKNRAFVRQGEWFFVPAPELRPEAWKILRREPLTRDARSKPHVCDEAYRVGGETVMVHATVAPTGVPLHRFAKLAPRTQRRPGWQRMVRNPAVYVRGRVRHADHATIRLDGWHRVFMNTEHEAPARRHVAFLD